MRGGYVSKYGEGFTALRPRSTLGKLGEDMLESTENDWAIDRDAADRDRGIISEWSRSGC